MTFISVIRLAKLCLIAHVCRAALPDNYRSLSGQQKQELQWNEILATKNDYNYLPTEFPKATTNGKLLQDPQYLLTSFLNRNDEQPPGRNRQIIGPYGVVAKVDLRTFQNSTTPFTGIFQSGGTGLIRISLDGVGGLNFTGGSLAPFVVLTVTKIYVDGDDSRNFFQLNDLRGQAPNHNVFQLNMNSIIDNSFIPVDNPQGKAFTDAISLLPGTDPLNRPKDNGNLGQIDSASIHSNGTNVTQPIVAPWKLIYVPNPKLSMDPNTTKDFRQNLIDGVKVGDVIYTVYGQATPTSTEMELIGELVCAGELVSSVYGDEKLFFRHPIPQWRPPTTA